jgi:hypothetical protein
VASSTTIWGESPYRFVRGVEGWGVTDRPSMTGQERLAEREIWGIAVGRWRGDSVNAREA